MVEVESKNIGINVLKTPQKKCESKNCPFHGNLKVHGRVRTVNVLSIKSRKTAKVWWKEQVFVKKYERVFISKRTMVVHLPECLDVQEGDVVKIAECRPISKMKNFVIIEKL
jgi:small subunit ribosomal protein S17